MSIHIRMNVKYVMKSEKNPMNYAIFYPDNYEDLPLVIYLHGAGERGEKYRHVFRHGIPKLLAQEHKYNAIILVPQCPAEFVWDSVVAELKGIIDTVVEEFSVKRDRISITGSSMGGFGTFMMGLTYSNFFAGIAPISGGGMSWRAQNLLTTPVYAVHGKKDMVVPIIYSEMMCQETNKKGGNARLLVLEEFEHNDAINYAYEHTDVIEWLISQRRVDFSSVPEACGQYF